MTVTRHPLRYPVGLLRGVPPDLDLVERLENNVLGLAGKESALASAFEGGLAAARPDVAARWAAARPDPRTVLASLGLFVWSMRAGTHPAEHARKWMRRLERCGIECEDVPAAARALVSALRQVSDSRWSATLETDWQETLDLASASIARERSR